MTRPRILVDMSGTLIHHGHIRLLRAAAAMGDVIVGLSTDSEINAHKGYLPELNYLERSEIIESFSFVSEVHPAPWIITEDFLASLSCDFLAHGEDNFNTVRADRVILLPRTVGVSSTEIRIRAAQILKIQRGLT